jgi:uncharacterized protein YkwD
MGGLSSRSSSRDPDGDADTTDTPYTPDASGPDTGPEASDGSDPTDGPGGPDAAPAPTMPSGTPVAGFPDLPDSAHDLPWAGLTAEEQLIVELINRARMDPAAEVARLNEPLASGIPGGPVEPLAVTSGLSAASRAHSQDMDDRNFFSHTNLDGQSPGARAIEEGHGSGFVGENIGVVGSSGTSFDRQLRAEAHHENLWISDGHQRNLMDARWSEIGTGYDYGDHEFDSQPGVVFPGSTFVTEMFGDRGRTYLTGVVIEDGDGDDFYDMGEGLGGVHVTAWDGTTAFATETWASGGYSLELPRGTYDVLFEGGGLDSPIARRVVIEDRNVKLDVIEDRGTVAFASRLPEPAPAASSVLDFLPTVPMQDPPPEEMEEDLALA